jgi:hypothetical protein
LQTAGRAVAKVARSGDLIFSDSEPQVGDLLADAATEQWSCYSHHDARVVRYIAKILAEANVLAEV